MKKGHWICQSVQGDAAEPTPMAQRIQMIQELVALLLTLKIIRKTL